MSVEKEEVVTIQVIGVDRKKHRADPSKDVSICGVKILRKKLTVVDISLFNCYECSY